MTLRDIWSIAWKRFNVIAAVVGDVQGRIIALTFYFTILMPFGLISRLFTDPLRQKDKQARWLARAPLAEDLESARQQG